MTEAILVDRSDPACVVVTLNRPEKRNALTLALWRELTSTFAALEDDKHARVVILTGAGGYFCAGADISEFAEVRTGKAAGEIYEAAVEQCNVASRPYPNQPSPQSVVSVSAAVLPLLKCAIFGSLIRLLFLPCHRQDSVSSTAGTNAKHCSRS